MKGFTMGLRENWAGIVLNSSESLSHLPSGQDFGDHEGTQKTLEFGWALPQQGLVMASLLWL